MRSSHPPLWHLSSAAWEPAKEVGSKAEVAVKAIKPLWSWSWNWSLSWTWSWSWSWSCLGAQFKAETNAVRQQNHFQELAGKQGKRLSTRFAGRSVLQLCCTARKIGFQLVLKFLYQFFWSKSLESYNFLTNISKTFLNHFRFHTKNGLNFLCVELLLIFLLPWVQPLHVACC